MMSTPPCVVSRAWREGSSDLSPTRGRDRDRRRPASPCRGPCRPSRDPSRTDPEGSCPGGADGDRVCEGSEKTPPSCSGRGVGDSNSGPTPSGSSQTALPASSNAVRSKRSTLSGSSSASLHSSFSSSSCHQSPTTSTIVLLSPAAAATATASWSPSSAEEGGRTLQSTAATYCLGWPRTRGRSIGRRRVMARRSELAECLQTGTPTPDQRRGALPAAQETGPDYRDNQNGLSRPQQMATWSQDTTK